MKKTWLLIASLMIAGLTLASCGSLQTKDGKTVLVYVNVEMKTSGRTVKEKQKLDDVQQSLEAYLVKLVKRQGISAVVAHSASDYIKASENYLLNVDVVDYDLKDTGRRTYVPYNPVPVAIYEQTIKVRYNLQSSRGSTGVSGSEVATTMGRTANATKAISEPIAESSAVKIKSYHVQ